MEVDGRPTEPTRVQDLWFEDGNLVISAGNSQYRVYRGILALHSPVFQDMFSFPQPPDSDSEMVDGCPIVRLTDAEEEVTSFLKAIFHPTFFPSFPAQTKFHTIVGCLRLGHKYGVDYLRRRALIHLSSGYRTKLSDLDALVFLRNGSEEHLPSKTRSWIAEETERGGITIIEAIKLAREVDAPWILPHAFHCLAIYYDPGEPDSGSNFNGAALELSAPDQQSIARGHSKQVLSSATEILRFLSHPLNITGCISPSVCISKRLRATERNRENLQINAAMPLEIWGSDEWKLLEGLCPTCLDVLKKKHANARQAFWDGLPELYDFPPWEELEKMKADAIGDNLFC
ncbi:hypothetical protein C8R45DRAFT_979372 [Mycena sanguinolenta]|nr:hypothetical protein C8R45DRAFT_979372 [Mycena sanguinolenta]